MKDGYLQVIDKELLWSKDHQDDFPHLSKDFIRGFHRGIEYARTLYLIVSKQDQE
jgi:hypothetical protein